MPSFFWQHPSSYILGTGVEEMGGEKGKKGKKGGDEIAQPREKRGVDSSFGVKGKGRMELAWRKRGGTHSIFINSLYPPLSLLPLFPQQKEKEKEEERKMKEKCLDFLFPFHTFPLFSKWKKTAFFVFFSFVSLFFKGKHRRH